MLDEKKYRFGVVSASRNDLCEALGFNVVGMKSNNSTIKFRILPKLLKEAILKYIYSFYLDDQTWLGEEEGFLYILNNYYNFSHSVT